ncbi:hypothetical protein EDD86DRAFT_250252 [Gorgonomyces haynaldii]|nr:hypothetical protein EDD86DRAFT_250252 [Gorgonomyces haynaldii]
MLFVLAQSNDFVPQSPPFANGNVIPGWPQNTDLNQCLSSCRDYQQGCVGLTWKQPSDSPQVCWIYSAIYSWTNDGICANNACQGYSKVEREYVDRRFFDQQYNPWALGGTLPGYPSYGGSFQQCHQACQATNACFAFVFRRRNPQTGEGTICYLKPQGVTWTTDQICGFDGRSLCSSYSKKTNPGLPQQIDTQVFEQQVYPFADGATLPGYPVYNQINTAYDCSFKCKTISSCGGFTFKQKDPLNPNDQTICWLKPFGVTWRDDGLCQQNGQQLCQGWSKLDQTGGVGQGPPVDQNLFLPVFGFGVGGTLPGFPTYDKQRNPYECSIECLRQPDCAGITFIYKNPANPSSNNLCFLKFQGTVWQNDGICFQNGYSLCASYKKRLYTAQG